MVELQQSESNKVGVVLIARQTSSRLPNKVLMEIAGKTILETILEKALRNTCEYVVAVPDSYENRNLRSFLRDRKINYISGSELNVLDRFVDAAASLDATYIQRLNCDNLLFDPGYVAQCYENVDGTVDIYSNVHAPNHTGQSIEIIKKDKCFISRVPTKHEAEHIFPYFYNSRDLSRSQLSAPKHTLFPIDTREDFDKARELMR